MATLTITEAAFERATLHAKVGGHASVADYVEELIEADMAHLMPASFATKEELEALILEGLNSPMKEMTKQDWATLREDILRQCEAGA
jgi:predicted CopG family antitoxin